MAPKVEQQRCAKTVFTDRFGGRPCGNYGKIKRGNKWYCNTHDPVKVEERRAAKSDAWEAQWKRDREAREAHRREDDEIQRRAECYPELLKALERLTRWVGMGIADGAYDRCAAPSVAKIDLDNAEAAIKKAGT